MDDLSEKLGSILNDPDSMARIRQMAENILGESGENSAQNTNDSPFAAEDMGKLLSIIGKLKSQSSDPRAQLLQALKPHLSDKRQEKVDTAVKILKLIDLLPLAKESGLLNF